jgi:hypothetical protein
MIRKLSHKSLGRSFVDGGLYHNNLINVAHEERQLLWPKSSSDIIVSIGSGCGICTEDSRDSTPTNEESSARGTSTWKDLLWIAVDQVTNNLDSKKTWEMFQIQHSSENRSVFRLSTELAAPIADLHEVDKIAALEEETRRFWTSSNKNHGLLDTVSKQLIATSFYFPVDNRDLTKEGYVCSGTYP